MKTKKVNRRNFIKISGLTLSAGIFLPQILTRPAFGAEGTEGIRIGVIGVGNQGRMHLLRNAKNVVAVCEVDKLRLADSKKQIEDRTGRTPALYSDYRKMLDDKNVDAVLIATPDHWHALQTIHACQAGKDVYVEKPLSLVILEGRLMVKAARKYNRIVQTGSQQRSDDKFRLACELVRSGKIGKLKTIKVGLPGVNFNEKPVPDSEPPAELDYDMWLGPAPYRPYNKNRVHYNFRFFWDYSGGQLTNWGAHHLDIAQWGMGTDDTGPVEIEGEARFNKDNLYEVPEWFSLKYKYANGVTVICGQSERSGTTFIGEKGEIYVNRGVLESNPPEIIKTELGPNDVHLYVSKDHHKNWYECILSRKLPIADVEIGHRSATVCHLGNIAIRTKRKIIWDPLSEEIVGDPEASKLMSYVYRKPWELPLIV
jgi:predicted dehydrogenase